MLDDTLQRAADSRRGVRGVFLFGMDGVQVAASGKIDDVPVDVLIASYADLLRKLATANREAELGEASELVMSCPTARLVLRTVTPEYGLLAVVDPAGNLGRARYELLKASLDLEPELAE